MKLLQICLFVLGAITVLNAQAEKSADQKKSLKMLMPNINIDSIKPTPIQSLYEVVSSGKVVYVTADGRYILQGNLIDRETGINLTENVKRDARLARLNELGDDNMLTFKAKGKTKNTITVFTDTSCGYCQKLHRDIPQLNKEGITVRYLMYPRAGLDSSGYKTLQSVWCAKNPQQAMTDAKARKSIPEKQCENPIEEHMSIAHDFNLRGTPMIVTDTGTLLPGYYPPEKLISLLKDQ